MPSFKPKNSKKIILTDKNSETLGGKHKEFLDEFYNNENIIIPKLLKEQKEFELELLNDTNSIEKNIELTENINANKKKINKLKSKKKQYLLKNSEHIFDYFENKKSISDGNNNDNDKSDASNFLNKFFKLEVDEKQDTTKETSYYTKIFYKY